MKLRTKMKFVAHATILLLFTVVKVNAQSTSTGIQVREQTLHLQIAKHWEADAEAMLEKWNRDYTTNERKQTISYNEQFATSDVVADNDAIRRKRLSELPTDISLPYNSQVKDGINLFVKNKKRLIPTLLALGEYYFPTIERIFDKYGLPPELKYLAVVESNLNPTVVSSSGAKGLWQFMLPTAKAYGLEVSSLVDERLDLEKSTDAAARHLLDLHRIYNDWLVVIAAYNAGVGTVNKAMRRSGDRTSFWDLYRYLPRQTRDYIPLFIATYYSMYYHSDYHMEALPFSYPSDIDTVYIHEKLFIKDICRRTNLPESFIRLINPQYKSTYIPGHIRPYALTLPLAAISKLERSAMQNIESSHASGEAPRPAEAIPPTQNVFPDPSRSYTIRKGDSLLKIARKHGISLQSLMDANNIKGHNYKLIPGKELQIPAKSN